MCSLISQKMDRILAYPLRRVNILTSIFAAQASAPWKLVGSVQTSLISDFRYPCTAAEQSGLRTQSDGVRFKCESISIGISPQPVGNAASLYTVPIGLPIGPTRRPARRMTQWRTSILQVLPHHTFSNI